MTRRYLVCFAALTVIVAAFVLLPGMAQEARRQDEKKAGAIPKALVDQARNDVELLEAQLDVHKALVEEAAIRFKVAKDRLEQLQKVGDATPQSALQEAKGQVDILQAQLRVKQAELRVGEVRLKHARQRISQLGKADHGHDHSGWWCQEHGVPEDICSLCMSPEMAKKMFKDKGDWCQIHDRAKSQCFRCDPSKYAKFEAMFTAKYGKKPPRPPEEEFKK